MKRKYLKKLTVTTMMFSIFSTLISCTKAEEIMDENTKKVKLENVKDYKIIIEDKKIDVREYGGSEDVIKFYDKVGDVEDYNWKPTSTDLWEEKEKWIKAVFAKEKNLDEIREWQIKAGYEVFRKQQDKKFNIGIITNLNELEELYPKEKLSKNFRNNVLKGYDEKFFENNLLIFNRGQLIDPNLNFLNQIPEYKITITQLPESHESNVKVFIEKKSKTNDDKSYKKYKKFTKYTNFLITIPKTMMKNDSFSFNLSYNFQTQKMYPHEK